MAILCRNYVPRILGRLLGLTLETVAASCRKALARSTQKKYVIAIVVVVIITVREQIG